MGSSLIIALARAAGQPGAPQEPPPAPAEDPAQTATPEQTAAAPDAPLPPPPGATAPPQAAQGVTVYTPDFFASASPANATDMVSRVPGFVLDTGDNVRGFAGAVGNVLVDGERPTVKGDELFDLIRRIPAASVARIELIRGGAPGIDMGGKPVVVNIVRSQASTSTALLAVANVSGPNGRQFPAMRLEATRRGPGYALEGGMFYGTGVNDSGGRGRQTRRDGAGLLLEDGPFTSITNYNAFEARGTGELRRPGSQVWRANFNYQWVDEEQEERADVLSANDVLLGFDRSYYYFERYRGSFGADHTRSLSERVNLSLQFLQSLQDASIDATSDGGGPVKRYVNEETSGETILRGSLAWRRSDTLSIEGGGEFAFNFLEGDTALSVGGVPIPLPSSSVRVTERRGEAFTTATWRPSPRWSIEAGLRVETSVIGQTGDADQERTFTFPKPRLNIAFSPDADSQIRLRLEREVGQLDFGDFVASASLENGQVNAGNADLEPERSWIVEAVYERRFWGRGSATLKLSHAEVEQVVDLIPIENLFDAPGNIGDGTRDLAQINLTLPLDRFGISGGLFSTEVQWRRSEVTDPLTRQRRRISSQSPMRWEAHFTQDVARFNLTWGVDVFGGFEEVYYRIREVRRVEIDTFATVFAEWRPATNLQLRVELQNVTNRERRQIREFYDGPRNLGVVDGSEYRSAAFPTLLYVRLRRTF